MKKIAYLSVYITLILCVFSCTNDRKDKTTDSDLDNKETIAKPGTIDDIPWHSELDTVTQVFSLKRNDLIKTTDLDSSNVIKALNKTYPESLLVWNRLSNDTAYVNIPDATYLTQQSGSLGAKLFLAESTYCITEIPGVKVVNFNFQVGDHASPGAYTRDDFNFSLP